ncbi:hypothetical protein ACKRZS_005009 [Fusarium odoratissimum]
MALPDHQLPSCRACPQRKENNKAGNDKKRNAAHRQNGKGAKRPQNEESEDEEEGRKTKRKRN